MKRLLILIIIFLLLSITIYQYITLSNSIDDMRTLRHEIADYTANVDKRIAGYDDIIAEIQDRQQMIVENQSSLIDLYAEMAEYTKDRYVMFNENDWED